MLLIWGFEWLFFSSFFCGDKKNAREKKKQQTQTNVWVLCLPTAVISVISGEIYREGGVILGVIHGIKLKNVLEYFVDVGQLYPLTSYIHWSCWYALAWAWGSLLCLFFHLYYQDPSGTRTEAASGLKASVTLRIAPCLYLTSYTANVVWSADQNARFYFKAAGDSEQVDGMWSGFPQPDP